MLGTPLAFIPPEVLEVGLGHREDRELVVDVVLDGNEDVEREVVAPRIV